MPAATVEILPRCDAVVPRLRVLIADDHPLILAGVRRTIEPLPDMDVVGEAHSGPELTALLQARRPDVVLMDLRMPGVSGLEMVALIRRRWPQTRTVVLSVCDDPETVDAALAAGACAYVLKSARTDIAAVLRQMGSRAGRAADAHPADPAAPALTERERSILAAVATGMTTAAISRDLWLSQHTIKFHLTNIYRKLGVPNRAAAVRWALENGVR